LIPLDNVLAGYAAGGVLVWLMELELSAKMATSKMQAIFMFFPEDSA
jgi:hypothetical protein